MMGMELEPVFLALTRPSPQELGLLFTVMMRVSIG